MKLIEELGSLVDKSLFSSMGFKVLEISYVLIDYTRRLLERV